MTPTSTPTASVLVCRGCCCGTGDLESPARLRRLQDVVRGLPAGRFRRTDCLGPCDERDVLVVTHRRVEAGGPRPTVTWLSHSETVEPELTAWLARGAPLPVPGVLADLVLDPRSFEATKECETALRQVARARKG